MADYKRIELFRDVTEEQWQDWHWQLQNRITDVETLKKVIKLTAEEEDGIRRCLETLRMAITIYASLMDGGSRLSVRRQAVPLPGNCTAASIWKTPGRRCGFSVPGLTHPIPIGFCSCDRPVLICRHCAGGALQHHR